MKNNRQIILNITAQLISYSVTMCISFFLTPYIVALLGSESYGFVTLANNFVSYAQIITMALNSMSSRYITIALNKNKFERANRYYTSVVITNIFLAVIMTAVGCLVVLFMDNFLNISSSSIVDIKLLWMLIFTNFVISLIGSSFEVATYSQNRIDLVSIKLINSYLIRAVLLILVYCFCKPQVWYIGGISIICTIYTVAWNFHYLKILLPNIILSKKYFDLKVVIEIISSGVWNTITRLGSILSTGTDLLICNLLISANAMGTLAISKTFITLINGICASIGVAFGPSFTIAFAKNSKKEMLKILMQSIRILSFMVNIMICILCVYGKDFYALWTPSQDSGNLWILSMLSVGYLAVESCVMTVYNIFTAYNKIKVNAIACIAQGILNIICVFFALKLTNWGIYAVAGISSILTILRVLLVVIPYANYLLQIKWRFLYGILVKNLIVLGLEIVVTILIHRLFVCDSWLMLLLSVACSSVFICILGLKIYLTHSDRKAIMVNLKKNRNTK